MPQPVIICINGRYATYSFSSGVKHQSGRDWVIRNDSDALAYALYLERRGKQEDAMDFLHNYLSQ